EKRQKLATCQLRSQICRHADVAVVVTVHMTDAAVATGPTFQTARDLGISAAVSNANFPIRMDLGVDTGDRLIKKLSGSVADRYDHRNSRQKPPTGSKSVSQIL